MGIFPSRILELLEEKSRGCPSVALVDGVLKKKKTKTPEQVFFLLDFFPDFSCFLEVNFPKNSLSLQLHLSCELQLVGIHPRGCNPQKWCGTGPKIQENMNQEPKFGPRIQMWGRGIRLDQKGAGASCGAPFPVDSLWIAPRFYSFPSISVILLFPSCLKCSSRSFPAGNPKCVIPR